MRKTKYTEPKFIYLKEVTFDKVLGFFVLDVIELHFSYIYICVFFQERGLEAAIKIICVQEQDIGKITSTEKDLAEL